MPLSARIVSFALASLVAASAGAETYRWTDAGGNLHFSQSLDQVPPEHRKAARDRASAKASRPDPVQTYGAVSPHRGAGPTARGRTIRVPFERYGHLMKVNVVLNDHLTVPFLIDTGASGVALPPSVVSRLAIPILPSTPQTFVRTANGVVRSPIIQLRAVQLGAARVENLDATVTSGLEIGLLGGSFFNNFVYGVDAAAGVITLAPNDRIKSGLDEGEWRARFRSVREPLTRLETYLQEKEISRTGRRRELEEHQSALREQLAALEREANHAGVPSAWRH